MGQNGPVPHISSQPPLSVRQQYDLRASGLLRERAQWNRLCAWSMIPVPPLGVQLGVLPTISAKAVS